ncbi:hypothetical protein F4778DRAFT_762268 [Xylariomycetidae sp. FL2044]|nr:hypothetical protein F4778DRAFT_762268 [Xylariomycetidae sp. FL2044]
MCLCPALLWHTYPLWIAVKCRLAGRTGLRNAMRHVRFAKELLPLLIGASCITPALAHTPALGKCSYQSRPPLS